MDLDQNPLQLCYQLIHQVLLLQLTVKFVVQLLNQLEQHLVNVIFHYFPLLKLGRVPGLQTKIKKLLKTC